MNPQSAVCVTSPSNIENNVEASFEYSNSIALNNPVLWGFKVFVLVGVVMVWYPTQRYDGLATHVVINLWGLLN